MKPQRITTFDHTYFYLLSIQQVSLVALHSFVHSATRRLAKRRLAKPSLAKRRLAKRRLTNIGEGWQSQINPRQKVKLETGRLADVYLSIDAITLGNQHSNHVCSRTWHTKMTMIVISMRWFTVSCLLCLHKCN